MKIAKKAKMRKESIDWNVDFSRLSIHDHLVIAEKCGCDRSYVGKVLAGTRNRQSKLAHRIYQIGKLMLDQIKRTEDILKKASIEQFDMD